MPKDREKNFHRNRKEKGKTERRRLREADNAVRNLDSVAPNDREVYVHSNVNEALLPSLDEENIVAGASLYGVSDGFDDDFDEIVKPFDYEDDFLDGHEDGLVDFTYEDKDVLLMDEARQSVDSKELTFRQQLASWAVLPGEKHVHVNELLKILRTHPCHIDLPYDVRTLIRTPRVVRVTKVHPGLYYHFGILTGLKSVLKLISFPTSIEFIDMLINIDGLPISDSTSATFWVILGVIRGVPGLEKKVFVVAIYYGQEKPSDANSYLKEFVAEMTRITLQKSEYD